MIETSLTIQIDAILGAGVLILMRGFNIGLYFLHVTDQGPEHSTVISSICRCCQNYV